MFRTDPPLCAVVLGRALLLKITRPNGVCSFGLFLERPFGFSLAVRFGVDLGAGVEHERDGYARVGLLDLGLDLGPHASCIER